MPRIHWKHIVAILGLIGCVAMFFGLPYLQSQRWEHTKRSSRAHMPVKSQAEIEEENEITAAVATDESQYAPEIGIRYIKQIPTTKVAMEAAFRQRRSDAAIMLPASEPLFITNFAGKLYRDDPTQRASSVQSTRRAVFSIGIDINDSDIRQIPWLSRSSVVSFVQGHFVSLQAWIVQDELTDQWHLHHRPIAALAHYGNSSATHNFVSPITETVADIRGLGVIRREVGHDETKTSMAQTAVWLFKSIRMAESIPSTYYDYAFVRVSGSDLEPTQFTVVLTANDRTEWHSLSAQNGAHAPHRSSETSTLGFVHFTEYASDGLHPKASATRSLRIQSKSVTTLDQIRAYLMKSELEGDWGNHLSEILDFVSAK